MKTVFVINPCAGKKNIKDFIQNIERNIPQDEDAEIYVTKGAGDACSFVRNYCRNYGPARFVACGGDGTLNEVLNGAVEYENVQIGVIPSGTGNDFCRNFDITVNDIFSDDSGIVKCDIIKYKTYTKNGIKEGYCANMFNIGFDCNVADLTASIKEKPFISGSLAYFVSILITLIKKKGNDLRIELDGKCVHNGKLLLTSIANGCYCGGGIKSNPCASVTDGCININIIKNISRIKFISLLPYYMKGTIFDNKKAQGIISTEKCTYVTVTPNKDNMRICIDGEITDAGKTEFSIVHNAFDFVVPCKSRCLNTLTK